MLDKEFWDNRYKSEQTGWDIGYPSTPIKAFFDGFNNKSVSILIPGCGRSYEAEYLFSIGFKNIHVLDISPTALNEFSERSTNFPENQLIEGDFFNHSGKYDIILEQTFFCAIDPDLRPSYVEHCHSLLNDAGQIVGLLFSEELNNDKPPFGGSEEEYVSLFSSRFYIKTMEIAKNSIPQRAGREFFITFQKKNV